MATVPEAAPVYQLYVPDQATTLGQLAESQFGNADKAQLLYDDYKDHVRLPDQLPAGAALKMPQDNESALMVFGVLTLFLVLVGVGLILPVPRTST